MMPPIETRELSCEQCGAVVRFAAVRSPQGMPDFLRLSPEFCEPESSWIGWCWGNEEQDKLALLVLCSSSCLAEWFESTEIPLHLRSSH